MFFDPTARPAAPDLARPSVAGLAYVLRNRHMWPLGFVFDYRRIDYCAMGLCKAIWPNAVKEPTPWDMTKALDISHIKAMSLFLSRPFRDGSNWTPEAIAADLDECARP